MALRRLGARELFGSWAPRRAVARLEDPAPGMGAVRTS
jgi:hypothetical protein